MKKIRISSAIATSIALSSLLTLTLSGQANAAPHSASGIILTYDLNKDQQLSAEEFVQARRARFAVTDTNNNGLIEEDEYVYEWEAKLQKRLQNDRTAQVEQTRVRFDAINKDEDNFISLDEFQASGKRGFDYLDENKDGVIKATDKLPTRERAARKAEKVTLRQAPTLRMPTTHSPKGMQGLYDINGDEQVTFDEYLTVREKQFHRTDENGDGMLTEREYLLEFEDRLDKQIEKTHKGQIKQTYVRFKVLDKDKSGGMTFKEYMASGHRAFDRYDTNGDGYLTLSDPAPKPRKKEKKDEKKEATQTARVSN